eukprot:TRINITY_DN43822_c0_g1_i2.p2 TRINITY_DN43822_c0_g1~~TRINITY_DN43822_c0_g1_i2.p2  ORF type:complete len:254 (+),score=62.09 TRINITY_DN43822_c0_g1_i2:64-825(+)
MPSMKRRPRVVALDCEMAGVGNRGRKSVLVRVSVVGRSGEVLMDVLVRPSGPVTDWRTHVTGIDAQSYEVPTGDLPSEVLCEEEAVARANSLLDAAVVVGHDLRHDFKLLGRHHHRHLLLRDTAFCPLLRAGLETSRRLGGSVALTALVEAWLPDDPFREAGIHSSVQDARAAMLLYRLIAPQWEEYVHKKWGEVPEAFLEEVPASSRKTRRKRPLGSNGAAGSGLGKRRRRQDLISGGLIRHRRGNPLMMST